MIALARFLRLPALSLALVLSALCALPAATARWVGTWATAPLAEPAAKDAQPLTGATLRQFVRVSLGGDRVRLRLSNAFGATPLVLQGASLALAAPAGSTAPAVEHPLTFAGRSSVSIPAGASYLSDPLDLALPALAEVAITFQLVQVPATLTIHGGSRSTSQLLPPGAAEPTKIVRWYFLNGLDVDTAAPAAAAVVLLGDSITDGYGIKTDTHTRVGDFLAQRAALDRGTVPLGVLNVAIGGNRLTGEGLGPAALARFDRDVLGQAGARWVLVFEGINDLGARVAARQHGQPFPLADEIIAALAQLATRARTAGLRVLGGTITPYEGAQYFSADGEADRQQVNAWIRTGGAFDAVVDFDAALRDPAQPARLAAAYDSGDHLHPSTVGYERLAAEIPLSLFVP